MTSVRLLEAKKPSHAVSEDTKNSKLGRLEVYKNSVFLTLSANHGKNKAKSALLRKTQSYLRINGPISIILESFKSR